jgi:hypothetical protein
VGKEKMRREETKTSPPSGKGWELLDAIIGVGGGGIEILWDQEREKDEKGKEE